MNRAGELVGLIFDGNLQSLVNDYAYAERQGRAVAVDVRALLEALRQVYDAGPLAEELLGHPSGFSQWVERHCAMGAHAPFNYIAASEAGNI